MAYEYILVEKAPGVAILTLNRPDKLNAMNRQLSEELHDAVKQMEADEASGALSSRGPGTVRSLRAAISTNNARTIACTPRRSWMHVAPSAAAAVTKSAPAPSRRLA